MILRSESSQIGLLYSSDLRSGICIHSILRSEDWFNYSKRRSLSWFNYSKCKFSFLFNWTISKRRSAYCWLTCLKRIMRDFKEKWRKCIRYGFKLITEALMKQNRHWYTHILYGCFCSTYSCSECWPMSFWNSISLWILLIRFCISGNLKWFHNVTVSYQIVYSLV